MSALDLSRKPIIGICGLLLIASTVPSAAESSTDGAVFNPAEWPAGIVPRLGAFPVEPDFGVLFAIEVGSPVRLGVSPGAPLTGTVNRIDRRSPTQFSVFGVLDDDPHGSFILVVEEDAVAGVIRAPGLDETYRVGYVANGIHEVESTAGKRFGGCLTESDGMAPADLSDLDAHDDTREDRGVGTGGCREPLRHFDVMIAYTPAARMEAGGTNAIIAECQLAVDTADVTYNNSRSNVRIVLVFRGEIAYSETGDFEKDRDRLTDPDDDFLDGVHAVRNTFGADFVSLFVSDANYEDCGKAYCLPEGEEEGFSVVNRSCASSNFSYAHELGHLQGCAHNREDTGDGCSFFCNSYGHRFFGDTGAWRTVMSYNDDPGTYMRIGWFSNPDVDFDGVPTGVEGDCDVGTNNALTIFSTAPSREDWRNPRFDVWVESGQSGPWEGTYQVPWPTVGQGVNAVYGGTSGIIRPELTIKPGVYRETLTINKPMTIRSCGGTARIGG